ncbi:MAG: HAMP domain-containing histidine kinase, partial [Campylobacterales bacterium]|nr:HAMP domain-containing histidine kinase [Campylobacterales bacterium]
AAMGEMINAISHQWRQPLNSLGLTIQNLQEAYNYNELDKKLIDSTVEESMGKLTYMSNTIDDFRNFFKSDKTKKLFNIKNIIDSSINILDAQMKFHNISWEIEGEDFTVEGQESEFSQVLIVLINNSKDAIIDKKEKNKEFKGKIKIYLDKEKKSIYVEDNGGGIQEENLEKIFDPYFTTKFQSQGTGIGLYMAKNIISNNLAGSLTVSNTKDGAKFKISLP